eukprot:4327495-Prymnesium_polylepis.1
MSDAVDGAQRCEVPQHDCAAKRHFSSLRSDPAPGLRHVAGARRPTRVPASFLLEYSIQSGGCGLSFLKSRIPGKSTSTTLLTGGGACWLLREGRAPKEYSDLWK